MGFNLGFKGLRTLSNTRIIWRRMLECTVNTKLERVDKSGRGPL